MKKPAKRNLEEKIFLDEKEYWDGTTGGSATTISVVEATSTYGSMTLYNTAFKGVCSGGLNEYSDPIVEEEAEFVCPKFETNLPARVSDVGVTPSPVEIKQVQETVMVEPAPPAIVHVIAPPEEEEEGLVGLLSQTAVGPAWKNGYKEEEEEAERRVLSGAESGRRLTSLDAGVEAFCDDRRRRRQLKGEETRELSPATGGLPSSYGSVLTKSGEYVIAFMGVKAATEPAMFMYTMMQTPVYAQYEDTMVVTTEGYALYLGQMLYCISVLTDGMEEPYVTGHSLGGSAASLYASLGVSPGAFLVTFGSSPMFPKTAFETKRSPVGSKWVNMVDLTSTENTKSVTFYYPFQVYPASVRFFHKFDPIPSDLLWGSQWVHAATTAYLLSDYPGCDGEMKGSAPAGLRGRNKRAGDLSKLYSFVCDDYDVQQASQPFSSWTGAMYYSYFNMINPFPCAEVLVGETYLMMEMADKYAFSWHGPRPFVPYEKLEQCVESFAGTMDAYFGTFLGINMMEVRDFDVEDDGDVIQAAIHYANFGLD